MIMNEKEPNGIMIVSERQNETKSTQDILRDIQEKLDYQTKLLESLVSNLSLSHKSKFDSSKILKSNMQLITGLMEGKNFEGKEQFMEIIDNITKMGSE